MNPRQSISGLVSDGLGDIALEHRADRSASTVMHSVGQFKITHRELGVVDVVEERIEMGLINAVVLRDFGI